MPPQIDSLAARFFPEYAVEANRFEWTLGSVQIERWSRPLRMKRALKAGGTSVGIALFCVILPVIHFVLVPVFLLAAPLVGGWIFGLESLVIGGQATCPCCGGDFKVARARERFPLRDVCATCHQGVRIEREGEGS